MKTSELLWLYQNGWRDFSGINLRGADLAGQDLSGANFSHCQIQGANFRGANLTGTEFIGARSGVPVDSDWLILSGLLLLSVNFIYSLCSAFIGYLIY
ncbi:pentapeptide repeat-containing protein [Pannus brasiliensis CCIBt3594]|uniref:Pentapeptide repeat-containing protein n=1 Tax=Pannus brasiliensis CCIBt3594 TaxID=1427578 RepID=A0AAW9QV18_9CHRO